MYTIKIGNNMVYSPAMSETGYNVINPTLTIEVNKAASLDFIVPDTNPNYARLTPLSQGAVKVLDGNNTIFWGRVETTQRDFYRRKTVHCESALSWLNDVYARPYQFSGTVSAYLTARLADYNAVVANNRKVSAGTVLGFSGNITREAYKYPPVFNELQEKLIERLGGYMTENYIGSTPAINYNASMSTGTQVIRFGKNLIDLEDYVSGEETYNRVIPLGELLDQQTGERLTIKSVNNNNDYLEANTSTYGRIERVFVHDDITTASALKTAGQADLAAGGTLAQTITISAVDLHLLDVNTAALEVGKKYRVISVPHSIDAYYPLTKATIRLQYPDQSVYTFGTTKRLITGG